MSTWRRSLRSMPTMSSGRAQSPRATGPPWRRPRPRRPRPRPRARTAKASITATRLRLHAAWRTVARGRSLSPRPAPA
eukprot:6582744-Prymnesium_polylepis.1